MDGPSADGQPAARLFQEEYERVNASHYGGALPPFPGVALVDRTDVFSLTRTFIPWPPGPRRLLPFVLSRHVTGDLLLEAIRHEIAHAAAIFLDGEEGHGPAWRRHAKRLGALAVATLDDGHHLRGSWPAP